MLQSYASEAGAKLRVLDLLPDSNNAVEPNGRRWKPGDPSPVLIVMDYVTGVEACLRNPLRYRPERMLDDEYAALVKSFKEAQP